MKNLKRDQNLTEQSLRFCENKKEILLSRNSVLQNEIDGIKNRLTHLMGRHSKLIEEIKLKEQEILILEMKKNDYLEKVNKWQRDVDAKVLELSSINDKAKARRLEASEYAYIGLNLEKAFNELNLKIEQGKCLHPFAIFNNLIKTIKDQEFDDVIVQRSLKEEKNKALSGSLYLRGLTITKDELKDILRPFLREIKKANIEINLKTKIQNHQICSELRLDWKFTQIDYSHQLHGE